MSRPFIPVPNTVSAELIYLYNNTITMENVIHIEKSTPFSAADIVSLRNMLKGWLSYPYMTHFYNNVCASRIRIKALDTLGSPMEDYTISPPYYGGSGVAGALPSSNCIALKLATGLTGRSFRGRVFIPITSSSALSGSNSNDVSTTMTNAYQSDWNALIAAIPAWNASAKMVITSYMSAGAWRAVGLNTPVITATFVDFHIDCQRRRLSGRGI